MHSMKNVFSFVMVTFCEQYLEMTFNKEIYFVMNVYDQPLLFGPAKTDSRNYNSSEAE